QGVTLSLDNLKLAAGSSIWATLHFNLAVPSLDPAAINAPNAALQQLHTEDGGLTWYVELAPQAGVVVASNNVLSIDLGKVIDISGAAGSGSAQSASYSVDTAVGTYVRSM